MFVVFHHMMHVLILQYQECVAILLGGHVYFLESFIYMHMHELSLHLVLVSISASHDLKGRSLQHVMFGVWLTSLIYIILAMRPQNY